MDSMKLAKEAQLAQYGESKRKTAVQGEDPKCGIRGSRGGGGSNHHDLAVVPTTVSHGGCHGHGSPTFLRFARLFLRLFGFYAVLSILCCNFVF